MFFTDLERRRPTWYDPPIYKRMTWICVPLSLALANMWAFVYGLELIPEVHVEFI